MKLRKKLILVVNYLSIRLLKKKHPFFLELRLTNKCNLKCTYCSIWNRKTKEMSTEEVFNIIDSVSKDCCFIHLSGGEPLLRKDIGAIISHIDKQDGIFLTIATNGYYLKEKLDVIKKVNLVVLSLDGPRQLHDSLRGEGSYDKVIEALDICKRNNIKAAVNMTLTSRNLDYINDVIVLAGKYSAKVLFEPILQHELAGKDMQELLLDRRKYQKSLDSIKSKNSIMMSTQCINYLKQYPSFKRRMKCWAGLSFFLIDVNGDVYPCNNFVDRVDAPNVVGLGTINAIKKVKSDNHCACGSNIFNELNLVMNLRISAIFKLIDSIIK